MTQSPPIEVTEQEWVIISAILQKHLPKITVWVFGSRAKRQAKKYSDLDLAIVSKDPLEISTIASLNEAFEESNLPFKVDVLEWNLLSPSFQKIIEENHIVIQ
jgi:type I restriction enzyme S subunit